MSTAELTRCPNCKQQISLPGRYCSNCGKSLTPALSWRSKTVMLCAALAVWALADQMASNLAGPRPQGTHDEKSLPAEEVYNDPVLQRLRDNAKSNPDDSEAWRALSFALQEKISASERPVPALLFEAIEALAQQLRLNPQDKQATRLMADLSFEQQAFSKAVEYYAKYMQLAPEDLDTRAKYASSLAFVGQFDDAVNELQAVLKENPQHFHALAYLAITHAQMGEKEKALDYGKQALAVAPSREAHQRFQDFLNSLQAQPDAPAKPKEPTTPQHEIETYVRTNSIAGPKFSHAELAAGNILKLYFENFPMQAMPPFAKEKFFGPIKNILQGQNDSAQKLAAVHFVDKSTAQVMEELKP